MTIIRCPYRVVVAVGSVHGGAALLLGADRGVDGVDGGLAGERARDARDGVASAVDVVAAVLALATGLAAPGQPGEWRWGRLGAVCGATLH